MQQHAKTTPAPRPTAPQLVEAGLDAAMATALLAHDPNAVEAAAGLASNGLIAAALGLETAPAEVEGEDPILAAWAAEEEEEVAADPRGDGHNEREEDDSRTDEGRKEIGGGMHRDAPGGPENGEGSGEHGRLDPTLADHASKTFWRGVAKTAKGMGLTNAGKHMDHYLDNSGSTLQIDLDDLEATCPTFADDVAHSRKTVRGDMMEGVDEAIEVGTTFCDEQQYTDYFRKSTSQDWYFALGGCTRNAAFHAECVSVDTHAVVEVEVEWELVDRYNWDEGKSVDIGGVTVDDSTLGRLHAVGLAQEYDVRGSRTDAFEIRLPLTDGVCPGQEGPERGRTGPSDREGRESMEDRG